MAIAVSQWPENAIAVVEGGGNCELQNLYFSAGPLITVYP